MMTPEQKLVMYLRLPGLRGNLRGHRLGVTDSIRGDIMGKEARIALLLAGSACLLAVMVEWVISELQ
jgi:hypothetical protein